MQTVIALPTVSQRRRIAISKTTQPPIFKLPVKLLKAIFFEAGLYSGLNIDFAYQRTNAGPWRDSFDKEYYEILEALGLDATTPDYSSYTESVLPLMLTCRLFYRETVAALCSTNDVLLQLNTLDGQRKLAKMSPAWISNLECLTLHLSGPAQNREQSLSAHEKQQRRFWPLSLTIEDDAVQFEHSSIATSLTRAQHFIKEWQTTWRTFRGILPAINRIHLQINAYVADDQTAEALLQPLLACPGDAVYHCSIRLNCLPQATRMRSFTAVAVRSLTINCSEHRQPSGTFAFLDLPFEVRRSILEYTDLVHPFGEIQYWNRDADTTSNTGCARVPPHSLQLSSSLRDQLQCYRNYFNGTPHYEYHSCGGYFCQTNQIAASSYPFYRCSAICWAFPIGLILANRRIHDEALEVFFRSNKFVVLPDEADVKMSLIALPKFLPVTKFLSRGLNGQANLWNNLRFLDVVFPCIASVSACDGRGGKMNSALQDWTDSLLRIRTDLNLSQLTIQITFARWRMCPDGMKTRKPQHPFDDVASINCYIELISPLSVLVGLARLYVMLPRIDCYEAASLYGYDISMEEVTRRRKHVEAVLERTIMGEEYNAVASGKESALRSRWLSRFHDQCHTFELEDDR